MIDHHALLVGAVGEDARGERDEQHRQAAERGDQADVVGGVGELQDEPPLRHVLHPRADQGRPLPEEEQPEVPVAQGRRTARRQAADIAGICAADELRGKAARAVTPQDPVATAPARNPHR